MVGFTSVDKLILQIEVQQQKAKAGIKEVDQVMNDLDKRIEKTKKSVGGMDAAMLGLGLSLLFTGMALKKFADDAIRGFVNVFMSLADAQNGALKDVMALQASFQFLKFTIFETFAQTDLFANIVSFLTEGALRLAEWAQQNPVMVELVGLMLVLGSALGTVAMLFGQILLLSVGLGISFGTMALVIGIVFAAITGLFLVWNSDMDKTTKILATLAVSLVTVATGAAALGVAISLPFLLVIGVIVVVITTLVLLSQKVGNIWNAFKALGIFLLFVLAQIGEAIINFMLVPINAVIIAINGVIRASNALLGTDFSLIQTISAPDLSGRVDVMRDRLIAEGQATNQGDASAGGGRGSSVVELGQDSIQGMVSGIVDGIINNTTIMPSTDQ